MQLQEFIDKVPATIYLSNHNYLIERVFNKLIQLKSVVLTAHRGWGKSAIIKEVGFRLISEKKEYRVIYFDMREVFEKSIFVKTLILEVCKKLSIAPPTQLASTSPPGFEILDVIDTMARKHKLKLILCISHFEHIRTFKLDFRQLRLLQLVLIKQKNCAYCFSSTNPALIHHIFRKVYSPMNRFGRVYFLNRPQSLYKDYVKGLFFYNGKEIEHRALIQILQLTENHLHYIRLLSYYAYLKCAGTCTIHDVEYAFSDLILAFQLHLQNQLYGLTAKQYSYLCALAEEQDRLCSGRVLKIYKLGRSSNVTRIRENLLAKELIEVQSKQASIIDPLLKHYILMRIRSHK